MSARRSMLFTLKNGAASSYAADFIAYYSITNPTTQSALVTLENTLTLGGLINYASPSSNRITNLYPMCGGTNVTQNLGNFLINSSLLTAYGGLTYNANGITGNGVNGYVDTNQNAAALSVSDFHFGFYDKTVSSGTYSDFGFGNINAAPFAAYITNNFGTALDDIPDSGFRVSYATPGTTNRFFCDSFYIDGLSPYPTTPKKFTYNNAVLYGSSIEPPFGTGNLVFLTGRTFYSPNTMNFAHYGRSLTPAQVTTVYNAIVAFNTTLGR
jgi:hypothetical protein